MLRHLRLQIVNDFQRQKLGSRAFLQLKAALQILKGDYAGVALTQAETIVAGLQSRPLAGLENFSSSSMNQSKLERFLVRGFGDKFRRNEFNGMSILLGLPDNLEDWTQQNCAVEVSDGRLGDDPPLSRPYNFTTDDPDLVESAKKDFDEMWKESEPVDLEKIAKLDEEQSKLRDRQED